MGNRRLRCARRGTYSTHQRDSDHPNAIESTNKPIGFGFEAPKPQQSSYQGGPGGGGGMGGMGGGMGRGGGMGGHGGGMGRGGGGGQHGEAPKPLNGWGTVSLTTVQPAR